MNWLSYYAITHILIILLSLGYVIGNESSTTYSSSDKIVIKLVRFALMLPYFALVFNWSNYAS